MFAEAPDPFIEVLPGAQSVAERAAEWIVSRVNGAPGMFRIALAGGNSPRGLYAELASRFRERIDWRRMELFWGDERFVPQSDSRSNYRMVRETLLRHVPIPTERIHPIFTEGDPETAARNYETVLRRAYGADAFLPMRPLFDLVLLGIGSDGHTASLFPGDAVLREHSRWAAPVFSRDEARITLTYPALQSSRAIAFLVIGAEKASAVERVLRGDVSLPAARVRSEGEIVWFLDCAAAEHLPQEKTHG